MSGAVLLCRDVIAQDWAGDARGPVSVEICGCAGFAELGGCDGGDSTAETVADDCEVVGGVGGCGDCEGGEDAVAGFEPAVVAVGDY